MEKAESAKKIFSRFCVDCVVSDIANNVENVVSAGEIATSS